MPYRFLRTDRNVEAGLRRIALQQIDGGLTRLGDAGGDRVSAIHDLRKRIKKLRGLIRLVRPGFDGFAEENAALRDAGRKLSGLRDMDVVLATHDALISGTGLPAETYTPIRTRLAAPSSAPHRPEQAGDSMAAFRDDLLALRERAAHWSISGKGRDQMIAGLQKTLASAHKAMRQAEATRSDTDLHEWRKHVKYHWYHCRLLTPIRPARLARRAEAAGDLGEDLGDHHDLSVYIRTLDGLGTPEMQEMIRDLRTRARDRQSALEARAFATSDRLFGGTPKKTARLCADWWRAWRRSG